MAEYDPIYDLNKDGKIDDADVAIFNAALGSIPGMPNWNPACDFDGNGVVNITDWGRLAQHIGAVADWYVEPKAKTGLMDWLPLPPWEGWPLPKWMKLYWPWYKGA